MLRLLTYSRRGLFFFKKIRIGIRLVTGSFKAVVFDHKKYSIFCFILALLPLMRILISYQLDTSLSESILLTELLVGQTFFDVIVDYSKLPVDFISLKLFLVKLLLYFMELVMHYFTLVVFINYISHVSYSQTHSVIKSIKYIPLLIKFVLVEMVILYFCAQMGFIGEFMQFAWQLMTSMSLQILVFDKHSLVHVLQKSFTYFKKLFGNLVGVDLFINLVLVTLTAFFYYIYQAQVVPTFGFLVGERVPLFPAFMALYLFSVVLVTETFTFTRLYQAYRAQG